MFYTVLQYDKRDIANYSMMLLISLINCRLACYGVTGVTQLGPG